jgi:hypothetical protein
MRNDLHEQEDSQYSFRNKSVNTAAPLVALSSSMMSGGSRRLVQGRPKSEHLCRLVSVVLHGGDGMA